MLSNKSFKAKCAAIRHYRRAKLVYLHPNSLNAGQQQLSRYSEQLCMKLKTFGEQRLTQLTDLCKLLNVLKPSGSAFLCPQIST